jgi:uncharacterized protein (DUF58 family)
MIDKKAWKEFLLALVLLLIALGLAITSSVLLNQEELFASKIVAGASLLLAIGVSLLYIPRLVRRIKASQVRLPVSFSVTREGAVYLLIICVIALAAINTGNNLLFLVVSILLAAIIASGVISRMALKDISVSLQVPDHLFAGEVVALKIAIRNHKRFLPSFSLSVEGYKEVRRSWKERLANAFVPQRWEAASQEQARANERQIFSHQVYFPIVPAQKNLSQSIVYIFPERGRYALSGFKVFTRFPFGFFKKGQKISAQGEILVYPKIFEVGSYFHLFPFLNGHQESLQKGWGENLYSHRRYLPGDDARFVDWKATAKMSQLMMREFAKEDERKVCLYFDNYMYGEATLDFHERFEKAVSLAASISSHFIEEGTEIELVLPDKSIPAGSGRLHMYKMLAFLAEVQPQEQTPSPSDNSSPTDRVQGVFAGLASRKIFKIILTSQPRGRFPSSVWSSSHVIYFDEL